MSDSTGKGGEGLPANIPQGDPTSTIVNAAKPGGPAARVPDYVHARLCVVQGKSAGRVLYLTSGTTVVGRSTSADMWLEDDGISREHLSVTYHHESREFRVNDLGSANGTRLNGSLVTSYALRNGDKLLAGETMLVFEVSATPW